MILLLEMTESWWDYFHFKTKFSREVVKMRGLCNINVWRRKSGNSMEGFFSNLPCISRIFRPECSFDRKDTMSPCIQVPDFPPRFPGAQGRRNEFCRFVKKLHNQSKTRIPSLAAWARIPGRRGSTDSIVIKFHSWILVQCKESVDANSRLFKETDDAALD